MPYDFYNPIEKDDITEVFYPVAKSTDIQWAPNTRGYSEFPQFRSLPPNTRAIIYNPENDEIYNDKASPKYTPIPHEQQIGQFYSALVDGGLNPYGPNVDIRVTNGSNSHNTPGSRFRIDITFRNTTIEPKVDDYMGFRATTFGSYDGSWAAHIAFSALRFWCDNGCVTPDYFIKVWEKHTHQIDLSQYGHRVANAVTLFKDSEANFREMATTPLPFSTAMNMFARLARTDTYRTPKQIHKSGADAHYFNTYGSNISLPRIKELEAKLIHSQEELGDTKYAAYNALTDWSSHFETTGKHYNVRVTREQEVARLLRSSAWTE